MNLVNEMFPETVHVELGQRSYDIAIGEHLLLQTGRLIRPFLRRPLVAIVTDENVAEKHLETLQSSLQAEGIVCRPIVLPYGEATKSFTQLAVLCDKLLEAGIERSDRIIAFGGGVIGDITGFAAAILRRGVGFIQIPTSLLAQVDSSIGGKTGINSQHGKNLIGTFYQPLTVVVDIALLNTLPRRQLAAGYAEVVKYGLLGDTVFFDWLEANGNAIFAGDSRSRIFAIKKSCEAKARIVAADETETGLRALLNLGHTFGHALEAATGFSSRLLHGEAISIGMVQAFKFSETLGVCPAETHRRVANHLSRNGLPVHISAIQGEVPSPTQLVEIMRQDKKAKAGKLTFILARGIGKAFVADDVPESDVVSFLKSDSSSPWH